MVTIFTTRYFNITSSDLSGTAGQTNRTYTLAHSVIVADSLEVHRSGSQLVEDTHFSKSGTTLTFLINTFSTDTFRITYQTSATVSSSSSVGFNDIRDDIGKAWNMIDGTTSTIVARLIVQAELDVIDVTGTVDGFNTAIRRMADVYAIQHALSGGQPQALGKDRLTSMKDNFISLGKTSLLRKGFNWDNITPGFRVSNQ